MLNWRPGRQAALLLQASIAVLAITTNAAHATMPGSSKFYTIHWNLTNPIFRIDNTDNVIDVNRNNMQFEYDQVNLVCPVYTSDTREEEMEKYIIYNVSKDEYETCRITNQNPRIIAVCDKPYKLMFFTITFRPYTPQPGGLEFLPGHDYYFISTSTSDDLHRRIGGRCTTHNMKIVFKVWAPPSTDSTSTTSSTSTTTNSPYLGGGGFYGGPYMYGNGSSIRPPPYHHYNGGRPPYWSSAAPPPSPLHPPSGGGGMSDVITPPTHHQRTAPTKKVKQPYGDKHPNEVGKSEELTLGGGNGGTGAASGDLGADQASGSATLQLLGVTRTRGGQVRWARSPWWWWLSVGSRSGTWLLAPLTVAVTSCALSSGYFQLTGR